MYTNLDGGHGLPPGQLADLPGCGAELPTGGATIAFPLQLLPALIGAFAGAPILAREMETGTFRYAWTQGFGRTRWIIAKLALVGGPRSWSGLLACGFTA